MAVVNPPVWLEAGTYTAEMDRLVTGLLIDRNYTTAGALLSLDTGVVGPKDQLQVTANGTMNVNISAGIAVVPRQTLDPPGVYLCYNNSSISLTVPTQPSNQRNDILCARVNDAEEGGTGDNWEIILVAGTASSSPVDPTVPTNYVKLARLNVKSAALNGGVDKITTSQVTDQRNFVAAPGGVHISWNGILPPAQSGRLVYDTTGSGLKLGVGNTYETLTTDEARALNTVVYGAQSAYHDDTVKKTGASSGNWDATPLDDGSETPVTAVNVDAAAQYRTIFRVTIASLGKCDNTDISGHLSVQVRSGSTEIYAAAIGRGPSFYGTFWVSSENSFIVSLPGTYLKQSLNFRVMFRTNYTGGGSGSTTYVKWQRTRLIVEPMVA